MKRFLRFFQKKYRHLYYFAVSCDKIKEKDIKKAGENMKDIIVKLKLKSLIKII